MEKSLIEKTTRSIKGKEQSALTIIFDATVSQSFQTWANISTSSPSSLPSLPSTIEFNPTEPLDGRHLYLYNVV